MSKTSNLWTPASKRSFHENVVNLHKWNREPCGAEDYRRKTARESDRYGLTYGEELHIADHIAFLAQSEEGARTVSAATLEEHRGDQALVIRVAANETPPREVIHGLEDIVKTVQAYAIKAKKRERHFEELFDKVVRFSRKRLHQRLRSEEEPWPWWTRKAEPSLFVKIRKQLHNLRTSSPVIPGDMELLCTKLKELADVYEEVDTLRGQKDDHDLLRAAVQKSFAVSTRGDQQSLEGQLKLLGCSEAVYQSRTVLQIDKIARYQGLCKDLLRLSRRHDFFTNIKIERCAAPPAVKPAGSNNPCFVHGEVQLILHYEQEPHDPPPRAIGSSKSACFLCDLLIKKHERFGISHSHKRLYHLWTIPDVNWMTEQQAARFQGIVVAMIDEMARLKNGPKQGGVFNGFESRAHLPFPAQLRSLTSTPSLLSQEMDLDDCPLSPPQTPPAKSEDDAGSVLQSAPGMFTPPASIRRPSSVMYLAHTDIPYSQRISLASSMLDLQIEEVGIIFEFLEIKAGSLSIQWTHELDERDCVHQIVNIVDVPSEREMRLSSDASSTLTFLKLYKQRFVCIVFTWDESDSKGNGKEVAM